MNSGPFATDTWESVGREPIMEGRRLPRLIRFLRADSPFEGRSEFCLASQPTWTIGRVDAARELPVQDRGISTRDDMLMSVRHATLTRSAESWELRDASSKNGTFLNGERLEQARVLRDGDIIECGCSFFIYRDSVGDPGLVAHGGKLQAIDPAPLDYQVAPLLPFAVSDLGIHLHGETGTGKEVVARAIHEISGRTGAFVARNCATIPDTLFESELFGYAKGAFSGALSNRQGQIAVAAGGTLFLDEVAELSLAAQAKLLRVLELKEVQPIGSSVPVPVDFRLISATLCDLSARVADRRFRRDLYGRLGRSFEIPPLRMHKEDLGALIQALLAARLAGAAPKPRVRFKMAAARALVRYDWPFNVRELKQCIEAALMLALAEATDRSCCIEPRHLPATIHGGNSQSPEQELVSELASGVADQRGNVSDVAVLAALRAAGGNRAVAARSLGITERTVFRRLQRLRRSGLDV
jgi:transcriptional regulator with AAA-type ATPase domain